MSGDRRNIVLLTYDSLRADHCGHLGYDRDTTPVLDDLAEQGTTFENAIAPASRTNPSMAGTFTGRPLVVRDRVAKPEYARAHLQRHPTIAETLSHAGYATGAFCPNAYASRYYGFDTGFDYFEDFLFDSDTYRTLFDGALSDSRLFTTARNVRNFVRRQEAFKTWDTYVDDIERWAHSRSEPFFLWTFSLDTHYPYLTPRAYRTWSSFVDMYRYNWRCNQLIDEFDSDITPQEIRKIVDIYDDSIRFADRLIDELRDRLSAYDPVFVIHGDHGEAFDERGVYGHFYPSLYEENVHVPLVVSDGEHSATVRKPVSLLDMPEIVRRAGHLDSGAVEDVAHDWVYATDYDGRYDRNLTALRTEHLKYLVTSEADGTEHRELYDLRNDPGERRNLIGGGTSPAEEPLRQLVDRRIGHEAELLALTDAADRFAWEAEAPLLARR